MASVDHVDTARGSRNAPAVRQSPQFGRIAAGLHADLAAFAGDPSARIDDLQHPVFVMKNGTLHLSPEKQP